MPGMTSHRTTERHAAKTSRDHLWVPAVIAVVAFCDVWGGWTGLGNKSGFAHGTGWTLTVIVEAYWGYALYAWLAAAPGPRSRKFAKWSAVVVFVLSLAGQGFARLYVHKMPPTAVVMFVSALPVIVLALIAFLIHLRQLDRAEAAEAEGGAAEQTELAAASAALRQAEAERDTARQAAADATAEAEALTRQLAATGKQTGSGSGNRKPRKPKTTAGKDAPAADIDIYAAALDILDKEPDISASELGRRLNRSEGRGRQIKRELTQAAPQGPDGGA